MATTSTTASAPFTYPTRPPTPAPGSDQPAPAHPATPWLGFIIFSLLFAAAMAVAGWYYKYRSAQNLKFTEELRTNLLATMAGQDAPVVQRVPYRLRVDPNLQPPPAIPDDGKQAERDRQKKEKKKSKKARAAASGR